MSHPESFTSLKPLLLIDGECPFCRKIAGRVETAAKGKITIMPSQNGVGESLGISAQDRNATILLIESSGEMKSGAGAIIHLLNMSGGRIGVAVSYLHKRFPWFRFLAERVYACVARHRHLISKIIH